MVDFHLKDGSKLDRVALKKSGKFPPGIIATVTSSGYGYAVGTPTHKSGAEAVSRPAPRPTVRSGATISADTASKLSQAIGHSQKAIDTCQSLLDGPAAAPSQEPAPEEKLRRQWSHALNH